MKNTCYEKIRAYVKENGGFSMDKLKTTPEYKEYLKFMEELKKLDGKRVILKYKSCSALANTDIAEKEGRIKVEIDKDRTDIKFYPKRKRVWFMYLDGGLFEGWYATRIVMEIIDKKAR